MRLKAAFIFANAPIPTGIRRNCAAWKGFLSLYHNETFSANQCKAFENQPNTFHTAISKKQASGDGIGIPNFVIVANVEIAASVGTIVFIPNINETKHKI